MAINTNSSAYNKLLNQGYSDEQINKMYNQYQSGQSGKEVMSNTTPTAKSEYQGQGSTNSKDSPYTNQGQGNYTYNQDTQYYEKNQTSTPTSTTPTTQTTSTNEDAAKKIRDKWNSMTPEEQQNKLSNQKIADALAKYGIVPNKQTTTEQTTTPEKETQNKENQNGGNWDYQDNSDARMYEIANNLNNYKVTNPELFDNWDRFYNFFIAGKGRTPEQEQYLKDYFNAIKRYNSLDNLTSSNVGTLMAHGEVPEDYLNYLKYSNPQRYAEVMDAKDKAEDGIKNQAYLDSLAEEAGMSDSNAMKYAKDNKLIVDKNNDGVDDKLYIAPTEEELTKQNRINEIDSRIMEIKNMKKNMLDDLTKQYPGVPQSTLMGIVQDRTNDISKEYDDLMVERAGLVGSVEYLQNERSMESEARQQTINNIKTAYGMYYSYDPQGLSDLAQAQYSATNVTLDQADYGTDTQKQMALDAVLTPIYQQYGDIIQRPQAQVINDVMALAKSKGITLSQALEENFMSQLKKKPAYQSMQSSMNNAGWDIKNIYVDGKQQSVWYNPLTGETKPLGYSLNGETGKYDTVSINNFGEGDYQKYRDSLVKPYMREIANQSGDLESSAKNIAANMEGTYLGLNTCGYYVNDYIYGITGQQGTFGSSIQSKRDACDDTGLTGAQIGDAIVFDWTIAPEGLTGVLPEYGHVGFITGFNPEDGSLQVSSSISGKVQNRWIKPGDKWYKNIYGTKHLNYKDATSDYGYGENPMSSYFAKLGGGDLNADQKKDLKFVTQSYNLLYRIASSGDLDHLITRGDAEKLIQNMNSKAFQSTEGDKTFSAVKSMLTKNISDPASLKTIGDIAELITLKLRKESGAAISAGEWASGFESFLPGAGEDYDTSFAKYIRFEQDYLMPSVVYAGGDIADYKPLFSPNSPYYKKDNGQTQETTPGATAKGTWNLNTNSGVGNTMGTNMYNGGQFDTLFTQLNLG